MIINNQIFDKYYTIADEMIDNLYIGKTNTLYYITKKDCTNCNENVYDGNIPFTNLCPYCGGKRYIEEETTDSIRLRVYVRHKDWIKIANIEIPNGRVQVIGYMSEVTKVLNCNKIQLYASGVITPFYKLATPIFPHGFGERYFITHLDPCLT